MGFRGWGHWFSSTPAGIGLRVYENGLQRYFKIRVCYKASIPLQIKIINVVFSFKSIICRFQIVLLQSVLEKMIEKKTLKRLVKS